MKAEIISIGTELLLGEIVNTNAQYIAKELASLGIDVYHQSVVGDNVGRLYEAYRVAFQRADLIITTGGLGPTKDDMTKEIAAKFLNRKLVPHNESLKIIEEFFSKRNLPVNDGNRKQGYFPEGAIILPNPNGTAPACIVEHNDKKLILLPGPPREMVPLFETEVIPYLKKYQDKVFVFKVLNISGIGEGHMEEIIMDIVDNQTNPTVAPYAKTQGLTLRIAASGFTYEEAEKLIVPVEKQIRDRLGDNIYGEGDTTLEAVVAELLIENKLTIATAESCTGGLLSGRLINYPGISSVFMEGVVTYSNQSKIRLLDVKPETLEKYGAVSQEVAKEMAEGIYKSAGTSIGISVTGIAGPAGETETSPVGLTYIGICMNGTTKVKKLNLSGDRNRIRNMITTSALDLLRREIINFSF
ncbi:competence/damage-inducible protein A [Alkaliphilus sp. MSJ-5]|uniref:Putative competence-damage inducible protein n=1 Tax=Alkaliphilus flagellatus TaxID=2841507 RepID=A0ABS6G6D4_9FIRM|nr:competence/damage-inducible protein A [Alkaliphilus flagellatus]MBU5676951.1 competence/damage-inducible protein A [Alkaliphilus flagellatus]